MYQSLFAQTGKLSWFVIKRSRLRFLIWLVVLVGLTAGTAASFLSLYPSEAERQALTSAMVNPATTAMVGRGYGLDNYTFGAMLGHQMLAMTALAAGIMNILFVSRNTRGDEEDGKTEMLLALPIGRTSSLASVLGTAFLLNSVLVLAMTAALMGLNIESINGAGAFLYSAAIGLCGCFFAAGTALSAQLAQGAKTTSGIGFGLLITTYALRAIGDVNENALSWLSPIGWAQQTEVFVNNIWWPLWLLAGTVLLITVAALYINAARDTGAGLFSARKGKKEAGLLLQSTGGLVFRLQRTGILFWSGALLLLGITYGSVLTDTEAFFETTDVMQGMISQTSDFTLSEQFLPVLMAVMSLIGTIPVVLAVLKIKAEEKKERMQHILGRSVSRIRLLGSYTVLSIVVSIVMLLATAGGMALAIDQESITIATVFASAFLYLPALWVMTGLAVLLIGFFPKYTFLIWLYLGYSYVAVYFGGIFQFPDWVAELTPFGWVASYPVDEVNTMPVVGLVLTVVMLGTAGFIGFARRDTNG